MGHALDAQGDPETLKTLFVLMQYQYSKINRRKSIEAVVTVAKECIITYTTRLRAHANPAQSARGAQDDTDIRSIASHGACRSSESSSTFIIIVYFAC